MTKITPFRALRPVRDKVHLVATRPYYTYKKNVLKAKLEDNPFTFLRIINPEFNAIKKTVPNSKERFNLVKEKYQEFINDGILFFDQKPGIYIYRQTKNGHQFTGIIAGASIEEYNTDKIKKHEATLTSRENMFTDYLDIVGYNAEPVLLSHPHNTEIDELLVSCTKDRPEYEFTTTDRVKHELWIVEDKYEDILIQAFDKIDATYIADGHHRSASSSRLLERRSLNGSTSFTNEKNFLAYFIDESKLKILAYNRLVKTLTGKTVDSFIQGLKQNFEVHPLFAFEQPSKAHEITICLKGDWFKLKCKEGIVDEYHPVKSLDAEIVTEYILNPILGIKDLKTDSNIEFFSEIEPYETIEKQIKEGKYDLALFLFPCTIEQVKKVADNHMIMPPKSTWVEPKMRSGLTIYPINE
jgi:uncharacterized protein (DUF1015 family)